MTKLRFMISKQMTQGGMLAADTADRESPFRYRIALLLLVSIPTGSARAVWTVIDLHPVGTTESFSDGGHGTQQVGWVEVNGERHASIWYGNSESWVDLNPGGVIYSEAQETSGELQVGYTNTSNPFNLIHAAMWNRTAASWVDLNPVGTTASRVWGICGNQQVGTAFGHAGFWTGTPESWTDLHPPAIVGGSSALATDCIQQVGFTMLISRDEGNAALWSGTAGSWINLNPIGSYASYALTVQAGRQFGRATIGNITRASMWIGSAASWTDLSPAGTTSSAILAVDGQQVGWAFVEGKQHASLWNGSAASWIDLHASLPIAFSSSMANSISHDGNITFVGGAARIGQPAKYHALVWVHTPTFGDLTGDDHVGPADLAQLLSQWGQCPTGKPTPPCPADLTGDGVVGPADLANLLAHWG